MKHSFKPIKPLRISEEVAQQLKQSILQGHFRPGDRLPTERELSEQFRISRAATREALRVLENAGFITTRQGATGGAFVTKLSFERMADVFLDLFVAGQISITEINHVRLLVEPEIARLAAQKAKAEDGDRLKAALNPEAGPEFHFVLAEMSGNRVLEGLLRSTISLTAKMVDAVSVAYRHPGEDHVALIDAVMSGNGEQAADLMRKHTIANGETLMKLEELFREKNQNAAL
jgi:GntR family transcriptional regulator, transcriptional repressor for pyruvate dehydrogenase complex